MLEKLFGSKTRVLLLRLFLNNPQRYFFVRELTRNLSLHLNSVRRELSNLEKIGIISSYTKKDLEKEAEKELKDNKRYYKLNNGFVFIDELKALLIKAHLVLEKSLAKKVEGLGNINFFLLSGAFVCRDDSLVDLLVVGRPNRKKLANLIKTFEKELGQQLNFTVMTREDFLYRKDVADKFIYDLLDNKNLVIIDKITPQPGKFKTKKLK